MKKDLKNILMRIFLTQNYSCLHILIKKGHISYLKHLTDRYVPYPINAEVTYKWL
jgi:hypothetical protein